MSLKKTHYSGHRARLKKRFKEVGERGLADYELLELLLFYVHARIDVKPIAKDLLMHFKSFNSLLEADETLLLQCEGVGEATVTLLRIIQAIHERSRRNEIIHQQVFLNWEDIIDYCFTSLSFKNTERMHVLFLDNKLKLIRDEEMQKGTVDKVHGYPREIVKRCLELGASSLILVHNHTSGDPLPSQSDIVFTNELSKAGQALSVTLQDHLIIGKNTYFSFRSKGLING